MSSSGVSWKEVIRRKYEKDTVNNLTQATEVNQEVNNENEYLAAESYSDSEEFMKNDLDNNYTRDLFQNSGINQTIVCQIISSEGTVPA